MEGLAAASALIAVISLAGQVAQGCSYLREVFENAEAAPMEMRLLINELGIIEGIIRGTPDANLHQEELEFCHERLSKLTQVVYKYGTLENAGRQRKWGKRLSMAMSADKIEKHLRSLREAKGYLQNVQNVSAHRNTLAKSNEILETVEQISTSQFEAARIMSRTEGKLEDVHTITTETQDALRQLADRLVHRDTIARSWAEHSIERLVNAVEKILEYKLEEHRSRPQVVSGIEKKTCDENGLPPAYSEKPECYQSSTSLVMRNPGLTSWELESSEVNSHTSWNQRDVPQYIEKISQYGIPMGHIFMRTVSTTYSTASEMDGLELPASFPNGWVHPAHFPITITMTEVVVLPQNLVEGHGAVIKHHNISGPFSTTSDVTYELKEISRPASPPFHMGHSTANPDGDESEASTEGIIEKLALGIVQRLRDFLPSSRCSDERTPYVRAAHFAWKLKSRPFRRRGGNLSSFFPCVVS